MAAIPKAKLELDIPYTELEESGWSIARLLCDLKPDKKLDTANDVYYEPNTGTLMLRPYQLNPIAWYSPNTDSLRVRAVDLYYQAAYWEEHPYPATGNIMSAPQYIMRTKLKPFDLISVLKIAEEVELEKAGGRKLYPILATKTAFPANAGVHVMLENHGRTGVLAEDYAGIMFGDFYLMLHNKGSADLFWSTDGTRAQGSWVWRKRFASISRVHGLVVNFGAPIAQNTVYHAMIIPFGRGHIMVTIWGSFGQIYSGVYSHPEASYAGGGLYNITHAGTVVIYVNGVDNKNIGLQISRVGFPPSGTFEDVLFGIPYAPTMTPTIVKNWALTGGSPGLTAELLDEYGNAFVADGTKDKIKVKGTLTASTDGYWSPFFDAYHIIIPAKIKSYTPSTIAVDEDNISSIQVSDGDKFEDQKIAVELRDLGDKENISSLVRRCRINGRLSFNDTSYMLGEFEKSRTISQKRLNKITLTGKNLGVARISRKRIAWSQNYGGITHPDVIRNLLMLSGFEDVNIITDTDDLAFPETTQQGGTEEGKPEFKSQPDFNTGMIDFIQQILDGFSGWRLHYDADGKWRYQPKTLPTSAAAAFYNETGSREIGRLWYNTNVESECEPPKGNVLYLIGQNDQKEFIANYAIAPWSIDGKPDGSHPLNYLGCRQEIYVFNRFFNTPEKLDAILDLYADAAFEAAMKITWKGPFSKDITIGSGVMLEGIGLVEVISFTAQAASPKELFKTAGTTYVGRLLTDTGVIGKSAIRNDASQFMNTISEKLSNVMGLDFTKLIPQLKIMTSQKLDNQKKQKIIRDNITWSGTPILKYME